MTRLPFFCLIAVTTFIHWSAAGADAQRGSLEITVTDKASGMPIAARMHLRDARGRAVRPPRTIYWKDHFVFDGTCTLDLHPGQYEFELERGPEYKIRTGNFTIERNGESRHAFEMERFADLAAEGWWSGDLHIHRDPDEIELHMRAEDLHIGPVITWWNARNLWQERPLPEDPLRSFDGDRFYHLMAGEDEREGGALLYFGLQRPIPIQDAQREFPSPVTFLRMARERPQVHVDIEKPFWWDVPIWVATGSVDSVGVANNHMQRSGMLATEAWGKPRDGRLYPGPRGNGRWTQFLYYQLLEAGVRLPPSAGSASGVLANPVGYNRVYVYCGEELDWETWWENLRAGKVVVTNGPLMRPRVNGQLPGHVFEAGVGETVELEAALTLSVREKVDYLEIIQNGEVVREVALRDYAAAGGKLPKITFQESGWMLIRAVTQNPDTYRFASSGPFYVEIGQESRVSRSAAQFFLDWVDERAKRVDLPDAEQRASVLQHHEMAREFWQQRVQRANAD